MILSWFNISASIGLTWYLLKNKKPFAEGIEQGESVDNQQKHLGEFSEALCVGKGRGGLPLEVDESPYTKPQGKLVEAQINRVVFPELTIKRYDVRRPRDIVDSQC
jgi:hypothetical protein